MNKRYAVLLTLPVSIVLNTALSFSQGHAAELPSVAIGEIQPTTQIASFSTPSVSNFLSPLHPASVAPVAKPTAAILHPPGAATILPPPAATVSPSIKIKVPPKGKKAPGPAKNGNVPGSKKPRKKIRVITTALRPAGDSDDKIKYVALTFDDGPSPEYTPKVLALLKKENIHATFCLIGRHAKRYPELVRQIVADGHKIADHSMNHDLCLQKRSNKKIQQEILDTKILLESIVPGTTVEYFRAPGGNMDRRMKEMVDSWGMKLLGWSVDTKDWQKPGVEQIMSTIKAQLRNGGVILMHDAGGDRSETLESLQKVITQLKEQDYQFVFPG